MGRLTADERAEVLAMGAVVGVLMAVEDAIKTRIEISRTACREELSGPVRSQAVAEYHNGCVGMGYCLLGDVGNIRDRMLAPRKQAVAKDGRSDRRPKRPVVRSAGKQKTTSRRTSTAPKSDVGER